MSTRTYGQALLGWHRPRSNAFYAKEGQEMKTLLPPRSPTSSRHYSTSWGGHARKTVSSGGSIERLLAGSATLQALYAGNYVAQEA